MALWQESGYKRKPVSNTFGDGINTGVPSLYIGENECSDMLNMCGDKSPAITTRAGRVDYSTSLSTPYGFGMYSIYPLVQDSSVWKYDATPSTTPWTFANLQAGASTGFPAKFVTFDAGNITYTIWYNPPDIYEYHQAFTTGSDMTNAPEGTKYGISIHKNRIFIIKDKKIYYSALNKVNDWSTSGDAGNIEISNAPGDLRAIISFNDRIVIWSSATMHELTGSGPETFAIRDISMNIGCSAPMSVCENNGVLYWLANDGYYAYWGGMPTKISNPVKLYIENIANIANHKKAVAKAYKNNIYLSIAYGSSATDKNLLLIFDTENKKWYVQDGDFIEFATDENISKLLGMHADGRITQLETNTNDNSTEISWYFVTKPYNDMVFDSNIAVSDINIVYSGSTTASMAVYYSTSASSTSFNILIPSSDIVFSGEETKLTKDIPLSALQGLTWYRLKALGTGQVTVYAINRNIVSWGD